MTTAGKDIREGQHKEAGQTAEARVKSHLSKFLQHAHKLVLVDDTSVGAFALESDHPWDGPAGLRSWQVCKHTHTHL